MTKKKDLKRRIRERQTRSNEPYVIARRAVLSEDDATSEEPPPSGTDQDRAHDDTPDRGGHGGIDVVELEDVTSKGKELGFACTVSASTQLLEEVDAERALLRLHEVVRATSDDPGMEMFRAVIRGERPPRPEASKGSGDTMTQFMRRVRAGVGGVSDSGTMLALHVEGHQRAVMMVCQLGFGIVRPGQAPSITLTTAEAATVYVERIATRSLR